MIEIFDENRISAEKIYRDLNEEEKGHLIEMIAREFPEATLKAVALAVHDDLVRAKALENFATGKAVLY